MKKNLLFFGMFLSGICLQAQTIISSSASITQNDVNGYDWPIIINGGTISSPVVVILDESITLTSSSQYIIIVSDYVEFNGNNNTVTIDNVADSPGLLQNGTNSLMGFDNVTVNNVHVVSNSSTLSNYSGWIGQSYFGASVGNNVINNCSSSGDISNFSGGITGGYSNLAADHCYSTGNMGDAAGGIFGEGSSGTATNCYSLGDIGNYGGGIFGNISNGSATNCYSTGAIGQSSGGILGNSPMGTVSNCYSTGNIAAHGGGIIGAGGAGTVVNCYSIGNIDMNAGGIMGAYNSGTAHNCYSLGTIGIDAGGISGFTFYGSYINCYFAGGDAWSDNDANNILTDTGTVWTAIGPGMPFKLSSFNKIIYNPDYGSVSENTSACFNAGDFNNGTYYIVSVNGDPSGEPSLSIDANTGAVSVANSVTGTYLLKIIYSDATDGSYQINNFTVNILSTLPLTWRSFTVAPSGNAAWLQWSTASEQNTRDFTVQHSTNGSNWATISTVAAAGNSTSISNYSYLHADPVKGNNYYRIQQTDRDGKYSYSPVQHMNVAISSNSFSIINTIVSNGVLQVTMKAPASIQLYSNDGRLFWQKEFNTGLQAIDLSHVPKGIYFLKAKDAVEKIVVQ